MVGQAGADVFASKNSKIVALGTPDSLDALETLNKDNDTPGPLSEVSNVPQKDRTGLIDHVDSGSRSVLAGRK